MERCKKATERKWLGTLGQSCKLALSQLVSTKARERNAAERKAPAEKKAMEASQKVAQAMPGRPQKKAKNSRCPRALLHG
eukprot:3357743-Prorocentrum_lima.AAC.1